MFDVRIIRDCIYLEPLFWLPTLLDAYRKEIVSKLG